MGILKCGQKDNLNYTFGVKPEQMEKIAEEIETSFCPVCGRMIVVGMRYCPRCGEVVKQAG